MAACRPKAPGLAREANSRSILPMAAIGTLPPHHLTRPTIRRSCNFHAGGFWWSTTSSSNAQSLEVLLKALGQEVYTAFDGKEALEMVGKHRPDVVLLDIGLPIMDGYEVARRCREQAELAQITLVAMTGYGQDSDRQRSQEAGFNAHLVKPVDLDDLLLLLNQPGFAPHAP